MLLFDDFVVEVLNLLSIDRSSLSDDPSRWAEDPFELDSLQALQLIVGIEDLARPLVVPAEMPALGSLGNAYEYYASLARRSHHVTRA